MHTLHSYISYLFEVLIYAYIHISIWIFPLYQTHPKKPALGVLFFLCIHRTACRRATPWTSPTRTKLAENLWNTFKRLRATWISVEPRSLLVTRHESSTFPKIGSKNATNFWDCSKSLKSLVVYSSKSSDEKISLSMRDVILIVELFKNKISPLILNKIWKTFSYFLP